MAAYQLHFLEIQLVLIYGRLYLSTEYITGIGGMEKGVMPLKISVWLELISRWDSIINFNIATFE
jgi:hypothetical protein